MPQSPIENVQTRTQDQVEGDRPEAVIGNSPADIYQAYTRQAKELRNQLDDALSQRSSEIIGLAKLSGADLAGARAGVQERIGRLDKRIAGIEEQIAQADAQVAKAAAVPGSVEPWSNSNSGGDEEEAFFGGMSFAAALIFVWLFARGRLRKRRQRKNPAPALTGVPSEISSRLERLENVSESTAIEIERIGEGQRFITKLLSESAAKKRVGDGVEVPRP